MVHLPVKVKVGDLETSQIPQLQVCSFIVLSDDLLGPGTQPVAPPLGVDYSSSLVGVTLVALLYPELLFTATYVTLSLKITRPKGLAQHGCFKVVL
jgi:hypothetical protein